MDTRQIMCCLRYVSSFLGNLPSYQLTRLSITRSGTLVVNTYPHAEEFALLSHSFRIPIALLLLLRFLRTASIYSLRKILHQTQLLRMGLQIGTAAGGY